MPEFTFSDITTYVEKRAGTVIAANRESNKIEREDRIRVNTAHGERMGLIEDSITALKDVELRGIRDQLATLINRPNGWKHKAKQYAPTVGLPPGAILLWELAKSYFGDG